MPAPSTIRTDVDRWVERQRRAGKPTGAGLGQQLVRLLYGGSLLEQLAARTGSHAPREVAQ
jgi:hypothetical protein